MQRARLPRRSLARVGRPWRIPPRTQREKTRMSKKIIVIDDSRTMREQVRAGLEGAGYAVVEAADGQEGLEKIRKQPDLAMAICDVNMPNVNGIGMVEALKAE